MNEEKSHSYVTRDGCSEVLLRYKIKGRSGITHVFDLAYREKGRLKTLVDYWPEGEEEAYVALRLLGKLIDIKWGDKDVEYILVLPPTKGISSSLKVLENSLKEKGIKYRKVKG